MSGEPALKINRSVGTIGVMSGVPSVPTPFVRSLCDLVQFSQEYLCDAGETIHVEWATKSLHAMARNEIAAMARGEWVLYLDCDHSFEPDLLLRLLRLLNGAQIDVVTGIYQFKMPPHSPVLYTWNDARASFSPIVGWDMEQSAELLPIDAAGAGCLLVRRSIFKRIACELNEEPFANREGLGEDLSFFRRCALIGVQPYAALGVEAHHLIYHSLSLADWEREALGERREARLIALGGPAG